MDEGSSGGAGRVRKLHNPEEAKPGTHALASAVALREHGQILCRLDGRGTMVGRVHMSELADPGKRAKVRARACPCACSIRMPQQSSPPPSRRCSACFPPSHCTWSYSGRDVTILVARRSARVSNCRCGLRSDYALPRRRQPRRVRPSRIFMRCARAHRAHAYIRACPNAESMTTCFRARLPTLHGAETRTLL